LFRRDLESSKQVWSSIEGYPGDYEYGSFTEIRFDLDYDYIKPYIPPTDTHHTGFKYYRITGCEVNAVCPLRAREKGG
jgi:1,4-alpha-glucan branching enzyme